MHVNYTTSAAIVAMTINLFPKFMKPPIGNLITGLPNYYAAASKHILPMVEERMRLPPEERSVRDAYL